MIFDFLSVNSCAQLLRPVFTHPLNLFLFAFYIALKIILTYNIEPYISTVWK